MFKIMRIARIACWLGIISIFIGLVNITISPQLAVIFGLIGCILCFIGLFPVFVVYLYDIFREKK